jgi:hypothetical protein
MALKRRRANSFGTAWTKEDEAALLKSLRQGKQTIDELSRLFPDRPLAGLRAKIRRLRIKHNLFGSSYRKEKEDFTAQIASRVQPNTVFESYAGDGHQTFEWLKVAEIVYAAEKNRTKGRQFEATARRQGFKKLALSQGKWSVFKKGRKRIYFYAGDAVDAAAEIRSRRIEVDLIDLDTCGSSLMVLPVLLLLVRPSHLVITHGEYHSLRFQREDVLRRLLTHRDISKTPLPLDIDELGWELQKAVQVAALRAHNETVDSYWAELKSEKWLGSKNTGMLRRHYSIRKPHATADCINELSQSKARA